MVHKLLEDSTDDLCMQPAIWHGTQLAACSSWKYALRASRQMLSSDPEHLGALAVLCQSQLKLGNFDDALKTIRRLVRVNYAEPGYELLRSQALQSQGRLSDALSALLRAKAMCRREAMMDRIDRDIDLLAGCLNIDPDLLKIDNGVLDGCGIRPGMSGSLIPTIH